MKYLNFITGFVSIVTKIKKINQQHFQISRWKINSAMWKCHQRCFIQRSHHRIHVSSISKVIHTVGERANFMSCLAIRVRNGRVVIGQILQVDSHAVWSLLWIKLSWAANVTLSPNINHTNSSDWSPYIEEFDKRAKHFSFGDHCINSHTFISWQSMDIVRRKLMLVSIGT